MGYKLSKSIKKSKMAFIVMIGVWLALGILLIAPLSVTIVESTINEKLDFNTFSNNMFSNFGTIGSNLGKVFKSEYISTYGKGMGYCTAFVVLLFIVGLLKSRPKNEYTDIEHGSSDWCTSREAYNVLNPKEGILLAEKYYLPVDKRGNVNVMIVGRFWFR